MTLRQIHFYLLLLAFPAFASTLLSAQQIQPVAVPTAEISERFTVTVNGHAVDVAHAAASLEFVSFDTTNSITSTGNRVHWRPVEVVVTAKEPGFWDHGVEIEPWRLGVRPVRDGQTIRFKLQSPSKISISRPGDFLNHATMLFLFYGVAPQKPKPNAIVTNPGLSKTSLGDEHTQDGKHVTAPEVKGKNPDESGKKREPLRVTAVTSASSTPDNFRIIPAGVHRESINPKSGETIYLEPGAWIYGSINLFHVENVNILGRGTIVYAGPQNPKDDDGWKQIPDWHCIGAVEAKNIHIEGVTCIIRSRTWSIQMKDTEGFAYDDLRVIGGNPENANQDGMDWLGGGNATVRDSFLRASDDVFAMQGNWDGYSDADLKRPGHDVHDILIEHSVLSTSISNIVRAGWPQKQYNSRNFTLRDSDILHGGIGACGQSFGLLGFWGANGTSGSHTNYHFENLHLEHWYSLVQLEQEQPALDGFIFKNIWEMDSPPLVASTITGNVNHVVFENVKYGSDAALTDADLPLVASGSAQQPTISVGDGIKANFTISPPVVTVGALVRFDAATVPPKKGQRVSYHWRFGDGTESWGRHASHQYRDALGSDLDAKNGAGRFRVMLEVVAEVHAQTKLVTTETDWATRGLVVVREWKEPVKLTQPMDSGLEWKLYPGHWNLLPDFSKLSPVFADISSSLHVNAQGFTQYAAVWEGLLDVPADGGYSFTVMARDGARLLIDGEELARTGPPFAQVCGAEGNAWRMERGSIGLRAGRHRIRVEGIHSSSRGAPRVLWEGPGISLTDIPESTYSHERMDMLSQ